MTIEAKQVKGINFVKVMLEVESLIQSGWALQARGTMFNGVQYYVSLVRGVANDSATESKEESVKTEVVTSDKASDDKQKTTPKKQTTQKSPVKTSVEIKSDE